MKFEKLIPSYKDYLWGGKRLYGMYRKGSPDSVIAESWEASCHPDGETRLTDGRTLREYIAEDPEVLGTERLSDEFPILIKFIDAETSLSLQVHPDDSTAKALENGVGKTEMWYVVDAKKGSRIYCGLRDGVTKDDVSEAIATNTLEEKLNSFDSKKGDVFFVEAGTVHAIGGGNTILEIQQNSNITYRLYDWGRVGNDGKPRELHVEKGLISIKDIPYEKRSTPLSDGMRVLGVSKYFKVSELELTGVRFFETDKKSYNVITLVSGKATLDGESLRAGDSVFIPAGYGKWTLEGEATVIMTQNSPRYFVGIDLGGTNIATAVVDENGKIYGRAKRKTNAPRPYKEICADMAECARECVKASGMTMDQIESIGVGSPGSVNKEEGIVEFSNNLNFRNAPISACLEEMLGKKIYLENDANAAAWGEYVTGSGKDVKSLVVITLGTGVGSGIVENGRLITGAWGKGAELGHTVIMAGGEPCNCGRRGCLEAYTSATALIRQTKKAMEQNPKSELWKAVNGDIKAVNGKTPFLAHDIVAKNVVNTYLSYLAEGVVNVINLLQPEIVAIGGGISHEGEGILIPLREKVREQSFARFSEKQTKIVLATLGNDAGIIGAGLLGV